MKQLPSVPDVGSFLGFEWRGDGHAVTPRLVFLFKRLSLVYVCACISSSSCVATRCDNIHRSSSDFL